MNSVFDLNRWLLYTGKHWNENKRKYLLSLGAMAGLLILWFSFLNLVNPENPVNYNIQLITYYVGIVLTGCLYASVMFNDLSDAPKAIQFLLIPASHLEKLLTALLFGVVLFFICYTLIFYCVDIPMVKLWNEILRPRALEAHVNVYPEQDVVNVFLPKDFAGGKEFLYFILGYFAIQSIFLLGSVYFVRFQFVKTLISGLIVFLVLVFYFHKIIESFMPHGNFFEPFTVYRIYDTGKGDLMVELPGWLSSILLFLMKYALPPSLWVVIYFRLKEKEV